MIERLIRMAFERIHEKLKYALERGAGPVFWIGGSEQATPPMMSPRLYDDLVVKYDGQLIALIHKYGQYAHVHCHGKIAGILDRLLDMGADMLDPVEPPPDGDIEIEEAKRRAAGRMTLMGNIEFRHLEFATPPEIDALVRRALSGPKDHLILYPSATAIARLSDRYRDNAIQYIESGVEYGAF
jgi:uroporphyrinogen-III decarboxylase